MLRYEVDSCYSCCVFMGVLACCMPVLSSLGALQELGTSRWEMVTISMCLTVNIIILGTSLQDMAPPTSILQRPDSDSLQVQNYTDGRTKARTNKAMLR